MLNKQGPGKIDWTDYSWNPISGCLHKCSYCYMLRLVERFQYDFSPKFHADRMEDLNKLKEPSRIFVCSSGDMFGDWVPPKTINIVLRKIEEYPQHTFLFLTKNPKRYAEFKFPSNCWLGTTIDGTNRTISNIYGLLDATETYPNKKFVSFEPLLEFDNMIKISSLAMSRIHWIIIGADSNKGAQQPPGKWADNIMRVAAQFNIPCWVKDNFRNFYKIHPKPVKEFPK